MQLDEFKKLGVGETVYLPNTDSYTVVTGIDYQFNRILTIDGLILTLDNFENKNYLIKMHELNRILLSADIGVLDTRINKLIDSGDENNMALILELFNLKKDKEKELTST